jgi:hypothetical protein
VRVAPNFPFKGLTLATLQAMRPRQFFRQPPLNGAALCHPWPHLRLDLGDLRLEDASGRDLPLRHLLDDGEKSGWDVSSPADQRHIGLLIGVRASRRLR